MSNGHACCILGICCPPGGAKQRADLKQWLLDKMHVDPSMTPEEFEKHVDAELDKLPWKKEEG